MRVFAVHPSFTLAWTDLVPKPWPTSDVMIVMYSGGTVEGKITQDGQPIGGVKITATIWSLEDQENLVELCNYAKMKSVGDFYSWTDEEGRYSLRKLPPGNYTFDAVWKINPEEWPEEIHFSEDLFIEDGTVVIAVSQSGETADTLAALREARQRGALALGVVNAVGSTIARETDAGIYLHVGPEIGVASTKAFTGQVTVLTMMALYLARRRLMAEEQIRRYIDALQAIPEQIEQVLKQSDVIKDTVAQYVSAENWLFLGRGYNYPVALEGALKLKEISYIHAEGLPAAEMKHGPIALIHDGMPVVVVAPRCATYEKAVGNIEEVRARGGKVVAVATEGDEEIARYAEHVFYVPDCLAALQPLLTVIPLQLLAYHAAVARGCNVDKPRNLAKSVTVE